MPLIIPEDSALSHPWKDGMAQRDTSPLEHSEETEEALALDQMDKKSYD